MFDNHDDCADRCEDCLCVEDCPDAHGNPDYPYYIEREDDTQ